MLKLENIKVSYKLAAIVIVGIVGFLSLLFISANALKENLVAEREARLKAVIQKHPISGGLSQPNPTQRTSSRASQSPD